MPTRLLSRLVSLLRRPLANTTPQSVNRAPEAELTSASAPEPKQVSLQQKTTPALKDPWRLAA